MNPDPSIDYKLRVSKLAKRLSLRYDHHGLRIISPRHISDKQARDLISRHWSWITAQQQMFTKDRQELADGSEVEIFGGKEKIRYQLAEAGKVTEAGEFLVVSAPAGGHSDTLHKWLRRTARQGIIARVEELAGQHGFTYQHVAVRDQTSRWGSCSSERNLNFSWRLMLAPMEVMDYVIIHELAHTKQMNHSAAFWEIVGYCFPNYRHTKRWLKANGQFLHQY